MDGDGWAAWAWYAARRVFWRMIGMFGLGWNLSLMAYWRRAAAVPFLVFRLPSGLHEEWFSGCLLLADILRGNVVGEPDLVVAQIKRMPCGVHGGGVDAQHDGFAVALSDFLRGGDVGG